MKEIKPKFPLGRTVATQGVNEEISQEEIQLALTRHVLGDWGNLCDEDKQLNEDALVNDTRLVSKYQTSDGVDFLVITEWDRSMTTVLLPSEY